jgi:S-adenosylmethionine synthetase
VETLKLKQPIFRPSATYGHFGRSPERRRVGDREVDCFTWEQTNRVEDLRLAVQRAPEHRGSTARA